MDNLDARCWMLDAGCVCIGLWVEASLRALLNLSGLCG